MRNEIKNMKNLIYLLACVSFIYSQQGLQLNDLEPGDSGKLMYPYSGKTFDLWPNGKERMSV